MSNGKRKSTSQRTKRQNATHQRARSVAWQRIFLAQLRINGNITRSCQMAEIERSTAYRLRESDPKFAAQWDEALEVAIDRLEEEAYRRAKEGNIKGVYYKGNVVGFENEYSDSLMTLLLKANRPEKYADKLLIKVTPDQAEVLKRFNKSASEAFEELINNLVQSERSKND